MNRNFGDFNGRENPQSWREQIYFFINRMQHFTPEQKRIAQSYLRSFFIRTQAVRGDQLFKYFEDFVGAAFDDWGKQGKMTKRQYFNLLDSARAQQEGHGLPSNEICHIDDCSIIQGKADAVTAMFKKITPNFGAIYLVQKIVDMAYPYLTFNMVEFLADCQQLQLLKSYNKEMERLYCLWEWQYWKRLCVGCNTVTEMKEKRYRTNVQGQIIEEEIPMKDWKRFNMPYVQHDSPFKHSKEFEKIFLGTKTMNCIEDPESTDHGGSQFKRYTLKRNYPLSAKDLVCRRATLKVTGQKEKILWECQECHHLNSNMKDIFETSALDMYKKSRRQMLNNQFMEEHKNDGVVMFFQAPPLGYDSEQDYTDRQNPLLGSKRIFINAFDKVPVFAERVDLNKVQCRVFPCFSAEEGQNNNYELPMQSDEDDYSVSDDGSFADNWRSE